MPVYRIGVSIIERIHGAATISTFGGSIKHQTEMCLWASNYGIVVEGLVILRQIKACIWR